LIKHVRPLPEGATPWPTEDPFLFCVHHNDAYPEGTPDFGPKASLQGRQIGQDFAGIDGWRMYHGRRVPGFPSHPHRGFETVTVVRRGLLDHADSLGAAARYGNGDVQWLTAGRGIQHAEMFPLLKSEEPNPLELFQIWVNLPQRSKMTEPHFAMLWDDSLPTLQAADDAGRKTDVRVIAGQMGDLVPPPPPPGSWAADPDNHVAIWTFKMAPGARYVIPAGAEGASRNVYYYKGGSLEVAGRQVDQGHLIGLESTQDAPLINGDQPSELLLLQGRPIREPVARYGPFVMNTRAEIRQAYQDYSRTRFGGWPWDRDDPVHGAEQRRFARYPDGREETPSG